MTMVVSGFGYARCRWPRVGLLTSLIVVIAGLAFAAVGGAEEAPPPLQLESVAEGVFAALQPAPLRFNDANTGFIIRARDVVVVDAPASAAAVAWLIAEIRRRTDKPVRYLINTHWHTDHVLGNHAFRVAFPEVEVVAHASVVDDFRDRAVPQLREEIATLEEAIPAAEQRLKDGVDRDGEPLGDRHDLLAQQIERAHQTLAEKRVAVPTPPSLTFETAMTLGTGADRIELRHHVAHTQGDVVVYLPGRRVLWTGDLLDALPFAGHGFLAPWIQTLDDLAELDVTATVPGHGPVFRDDAQRLRVRALLSDVWAAALDQVGEGKAAASDEQDERVAKAIRDQVDVAAHRAAFVSSEDDVAARNFDGFLPALIDRAIEQARDTIVP